MRYRVGAVVASAALVTAMLGPISPALAAGSSAPLRILLEVPLSSAALVDNAQTAENAAKAAVSVINKQGGVLGHPVQLTVVDEGGDPTTAVTKLEAAINSGSKPSVFLEGGASPEASAVLPILTQNKIVSFNEAPTLNSGDPASNPYNFDLSPSTPNYAEAFCPYVKAHGGKSVAILHGNDAYGDPLAAAMASACKADGIKVTGTQEFELTALDMTPQLEALQATHPSYLLLQAYGAPPGYVLQDMQKIGWKVPILGDDSVGVSAVVNMPPPTGDLGTPLEANLKVQTFASTVYRSPSKQPAALTTAIKAMEAQGAIKTTLILAYMYDGIILAANAAKKAGTTTNGPAIAAAVLKLKPGGPPTAIFPAYHFTAQSHSPNVSPSAFSFVPLTKVINGQFDAPGSK